MSKKLGKLILFSAMAGAAAAGTYYLLQKKNELPLKDSDAIDDFDDFDEDLDDDFDDQFSSYNKSRPYVSLDLENAKEIIGEKVMETIDKTKEKIVEFNVPEKLDKAKEFVGEYTHSFTDSSKSNNTEPTFSQTYTTVSTTPEHDAASEDDEPVETEEFFDDTEE